MSFPKIRVYKFIDARWGLTALCDRRLKISEVPHTNDPWELFPFEILNSYHEQASKKARDHIAKLAGILCFSVRWNHPMMWSHYADNHTGICLGFDLPRDPLKVLQVQYEPRLQPFPEKREDVNENLAKKVLVLKNSCWAYENEYRWFPSVQERSHGRAYVNFGDELQLREVLLGKNCELELPSIKRMVAEEPNSVEVRSVTCSKRKYEMVIDQ